MDRIGELIGRGKEAEVRRYGPHAVKLYPPGRGRAAVFREAAVLALADEAGLPVPAVVSASEIDGRWALVLERVEGPTMGALLEADPGRVPELMAEMVALQRQVHAAKVPELPGLKRRLAARIGRVGGAEALLEALPDGASLCHGDFHPYNLVAGPRGWVVLDWLDAAAGPPEADLGRTALLLDLALPALAGAWRAALGEVPGMADWRPVLAAARLAEGVAQEREVLRGMAGLAG